MMTNPTGRITQGQFSFLPDLTDEEIARAIAFMANKSGASFKEPPVAAAK